MREKIEKLTLFQPNMQARSSSVHDWSKTIVFPPFRRFSLLFSHSISILLTFVPWEFASSHPLFSISNRTKCRTVTPAGHLRYRVFLTWIVSSCFVWSAFARCRDPARFSGSWTAASPSGSSSSHKLRLTKSSKVKFRAPRGKAKGGHCGLTSRKWRLRSSSERKRPGTIRYTSRCSFTSGKSGGDVATLHTGHALAPLLNRLTIQPLQTEYRFDAFNVTLQVLGKKFSHRSRQFSITNRFVKKNIVVNLKKFSHRSEALY